MCADRTLFRHLKAAPTHWSNDQLDKMRGVTDEVADTLIAEYFSADGAPHPPHQLLSSLMAHRSRRRSGVGTGVAQGNDAAKKVPVPQDLLEELARRSPLPTMDPEEIRAGQQLFQDHGPEMLLALCCYSLPMAYSAANGAKVLHETGYLENRVARRLLETTQMVIDVMRPGGLEPGGQGITTAHEIRLLHATVRYLITHREANWDPAWGQPINQEDMAGTMMTFSYIVLDGLSRIGIDVYRPQQESYLAAWRGVGRIMGIHDELMPADMEQAQELTWAIFNRQTGPSKEGEDLTGALLDTMRSFTPWLLRPMCSSLMRVYVGKETAAVLGVPRHLLFDPLTRFGQRLYGAIDNLAHISPFGLAGYRMFSHVVIEILVRIARGDNAQAEFDLPLELHEYWKSSSIYWRRKGR